jgi:hypothetical protein
MMTNTACNGRRARLAGLWHHVALAAVLQTIMAGAASAAELSIREIKAQAPAPISERRPDQLPGSSIAYGKQNIAAVWLAGPTTRYDHGVLGDTMEASRLVAETRSGDTLVYELPASRVFEDLNPRLVDLNSDGEDEILLVETHAERGASLAIYGVTDARIVRQSMTPFLGQPHRWLNPLGAGDFDADGRLDIALVATPHIGGRLRLYRYAVPTLTLFAEAGGVSTHSIGSTELDLGRIVHHEDRDRILLPDQSHTSLLLLEWRPSGIKQLARQTLPAAIVTSLRPAGANRWRFQISGGRHLEVQVH